MKKFFFIILPALFLSDAFSQEASERKKYFNTTQVSILMGHRPFDQNHYNQQRNQLHVSPSVTMTHGGFLNDSWSAGAGVGIELIDHNLFPLFAEVKYAPRRNAVSPFFALKIGHAFGTNKKHYEYLLIDIWPYHFQNVYLKHHGGLMFQPEMGVRIPVDEKSDLMLSIAYRHQKTKTTVTENFDAKREWERKANMNRLVLGVAFTFR